jgi:hypothetical protein
VYPPLFHTLDLPAYKRAELSASETDPSSLSDTSSDTYSKLNFSIDKHLKPNTTLLNSKTTLSTLCLTTTTPLNSPSRVVDSLVVLATLLVVSLPVLEVSHQVCLYS